MWENVPAESLQNTSANLEKRRILCLQKTEPIYVFSFKIFTKMATSKLLTFCENLPFGGKEKVNLEKIRTDIKIETEFYT